MKREILYVLREEYYLIIMDVDKYTGINDITDFLDSREIDDKESLSKALNEYCKVHETSVYKPHWFFSGFDAVILNN